MIVAIETIVTAIVVGFWMFLATWFFYWLFLIGSRKEEDKIKRDFYFWGWLRYVLFTLVFTAGYGFYITQNSDWSDLIEFASTNTTKIIAGFFWVIAIAILAYFLIYRGIKKRRTLEF